MKTYETKNFRRRVECSRRILTDERRYWRKFFRGTARTFCGIELGSCKRHYENKIQRVQLNFADNVANDGGRGYACDLHGAFR